jgi:pimeloyl-ACP methyl ester carboxylesterase
MASSGTTWRAQELGPSERLELAQGTIRYHDVGSGPPLVFVHGALVNPNLWRKVVAKLSGRFRCVALELPIGAHLEPMPPTADLSPPAVADLVADAIEKLGLEGVTLVGNDTGGAICQIVVARRPERIGSLVLTSCDAFENFPPKAMKPAMPLLRLPGALPVLFAPVRLRAVRRRVLTMMRATKRRVEDRAVDSYALPAVEIPGVVRDTRRFLAAVDSRYTLDAASRLASFERPALIAWSREDKFFPTEHAERLAQILPNSRLEWIEDSYTFSPEDQPERVAELIGDFAGPAQGGAQDAAEPASARG